MSEQVSSTNLSPSGEATVPTLTPVQALQRASVVIITVGIIQLAGTFLPYLAATTGSNPPSAGLQSGVPLFANGWSRLLFAAGLTYVLCGLPIRFRFRPAIWIGMTAALAQAGVFVFLACLGIRAGIRSGDPGTLTMGVLLFGSIASIHLFVLRWLWLAR